MNSDYEIKLRIGRYWLAQHEDGYWFIGVNMPRYYKILMKWRRKNEKISSN